MAQGHLLKIRLFLEGVEVPVVSAAIQIAANSPATASIQVIATDAVMSLLPRTVVHLFYYDYVETGNVALDRKKANLSDKDYEEWFNSRYKILFMGEFITFKFQKSSGQRAVVLECTDFSNYWDTTFQYNFGGSLFAGRRQAAFIGANSNFFTSPLGHGVGTVSRLLNGKSVNYPELKGLLAGVVRMLEAIGGSYHGKNTFRGCNDFSSIAELRLKILQQIAAAEKDTSTARLFARKSFNMWMNRTTQSLGKLVSFRGLLKTCFKFIFHEVYPCPVARYVPSGTRQARKSWKVGMHQTGRYKGFYVKAQQALDYTQRARDALVAWRKSKTSGGNVSALTSAYIRLWVLAKKSVNELYAQGMAGAPKGTHRGLAVAKEKMGKIQSRSANAGGVISANLQGRGTLDRQYPQILIYYGDVITALKDVLGVKVTKSKTFTENTQPRVNNQIFRPDIWFTAPPRCNVLFPEMYDQFSFSRQFLREVSRIELQTHNEILGNDALFNGRYYAPNVEDVRRGVKLSSRRFARLIMDHELFTGIVPMFENMSEANLFAMRSGKVSKGGSKVSYAQRAVNFQYFKYRFDARSMSASGRFNPQFVPGFPSLIIDRPMSADQLRISSLPEAEQRVELGLDVPTLTRAEALRELVSPQYMGVCAALSHTVSQEGGMTSYQFIQSRLHREDTEFLGIDKGTAYEAAGVATKKTVVAAPVTSPPRKGSKGPKGGTITGVRNVTSSNVGRTYKLFGSYEKYRIGDTAQENIVTFTETSRPQFQSSLNESRVKIGAYEISESYTKYQKVDVDLPIEEAVAPPWIWDGWRVPKVSETYEQLFGTTAITDISGYVPAKLEDPIAGNRFFIGADAAEALQRDKSIHTSGANRLSPVARRDERSTAVIEAGINQNAKRLKDEEITVENSVDFLVRAYSFVKLNNLDVGDFLRAYGWRPVATMVDILGGRDLQIKKVEKKVKVAVKQKFLKKEANIVTIPYETPVPNPLGPQSVTKEDYYLNPDTQVLSQAVYGTKYVTRLVSRFVYEAEGKEGFHSRAFGDVEDLFGLVSPTVTRVLRLSSTSKRKVAERLDVRKRRRDVVVSYVAELTASRGLIG
jgi:hypothetical protein